MRKHLAFTLGACALFAASAGAQTIYETGFEDFNNGDLNGQQGWVAAPANAVNVRANGSAGEGAKHVEQAPGSIAERGFSSSADWVLLRALHRGAGAAEAQTPGDPAAAVVAFVATDASNYTVRAWNGAAGTPDFQAVTSTPVANTSWATVTVALSYLDGRYSVGVDDGVSAQHAFDLGFFSNTVSALTGFRSSSEVGADIDAFIVTESDGDFDNDGISDLAEAGKAGGNPFEVNSRPLDFADRDGDMAITMKDALEIIRFPSGGDNDINNDGATTAADGEMLLQWTIGELAVIPPLPAR